MKTIENPVCGRVNAWRLFSLSMLVVAGSLASAAESEDAKIYTLFMGTNLAVERNKTVYPVDGVEGGSLVIKVDGEPVKIPMDRGTVNLKVNQALKLTEAFATVENLKGERAYTSGNDPNLKFMADSSPDVGLAVEMGRAEGAAVQAIIGRGSVPSGSRGAIEAEAAMNGALAQAGSHAFAASSFGNSTGVRAQRLQSELEQELYDAMEISFELSAERSIGEPYVVVIAQFREKGAKPNEYQNWVYAKAIDAVDRRPLRVRILQGGFPPGFELKDFQVHLYEGRREIATNVAPKRVPLTADEAFEYVKIEYLATHKDATLPATPAMGRLPADLHQHLSGGKFDRPYFVRVSKDGVPEAAFVDQACLVKVEDPYLDSVLKRIRFKPALEKGKPVDAVAPLKLSELPL